MPRTLRASADFAQPASELFQVIVDYDRYRKWLPRVTHSKLLAREGDLCIAEMRVEPPYSRWTVECVHTPSRSVLMRKIGGDVPVERFQWDLGSGDGESRLSLAIEIQTGWNPFQQGPWRADRVLEACRRRLEQMSDTLESPDRIVDILELVQGPRGLILRVLGKEYLLRPLENSDD